MKRLLNVAGGLLGLLALIALVIALALIFGGLGRGTEPAPQAFQPSIETPTLPPYPPPAMPTPLGPPATPTKPVGTPVPPNPTLSLEPYPPPATATPWPSPTPTITPPTWPPITETIRIVNYIQLTSEDSGLPTWSPDGSKIAYWKGTDRFIQVSEHERIPVQEVWVMNADGTDQHKIADGNRPAWAPDGQRLAYVVPVDFQRAGIWVANVNGQGRRKLADADYGKCPQWVPGGPIAFVREGQPMWLNEDGTNLAPIGITIPVQRMHNGFWFSPDGRRLAYWSDGALHIEQVQERQLTPEAIIPARFPEALAWSPDGTKVAYAINVMTYPEIWVANADGTGVFQLVRMDRGNIRHLTWSHDSRFIAFSYGPTGSLVFDAVEIYVVKPTGSQPLNLTQNEREESALAWSPQSDEIAFMHGELLAQGPQVSAQIKRTIWLARLSIEQ